MQNPTHDKNFKKFHLFYLPSWPYNYESVMHYEHNQAAKNGLSALEPVDKTVLIINYHDIQIEIQNFE